MTSKEDLLNNKDFYKSFKNGEDLTSFFKELHKKAVEHMLDAELDSHLDNEKHEKTTNGNYRNGHGTKKIKSSFGESEIKVPRDREGSFEPALVPKRHNIIDGLENIIISFYAKGMSVSDIEEQIREMYDFEVSTSLRINSNLFAHIEKLAKQENRSLNNFIETTLFNALDYREANAITKTGIKESRKERTSLKKYSSTEEVFQDVEDK